MTADRVPVEAWRVSGVTRELDEAPDVVLARACATLGVLPADANDWRIARQSIDARGARPPRFELVVEVDVPAGAVPEHRQGGRVHRATQARLDPPPSVSSDERPVVVGMGPCGIFAALRLAVAGLRPIVLDRGKPVETRAKDVARLMGRGEIDPESNLCYGEGGAGTWSDGKLYTRVGGIHVRSVLETIVEHGGPPEILVNARPHLGTDRLVALLKALRKTLVDLGAEIRFETRVSRVLFADGRLTGFELGDGSVLPARYGILAPGHSARGLYRSLAESGVAMVPKPFAVGFRVEHPQALIDEVQYGRWAEHPELPAAYYELKANAGDRGVYSFCMCPGGSVVPTPTLSGEVCVNGMSHAARSGKYANSAIVVQVDVADTLPFARSDSAIDTLLAGVAFQERAEQLAWAQGGGEFVAPAQRLVDFIENRPSASVRRTTYKRGVASADLGALYPAGVTGALREGVRGFERRFRGFVSDEAVLIGVETRTSAPVSIVRDGTSLMCVNVDGLVPAGEGAGYGGGIVSAAIDGIRSADAVLRGVSADR